ncbi:hypothetical protein VRK_27010 [Vibrio sp. MEBiC08052]|nr:hypothetical protein VRK_27010 [Vibrio sp. MEBiC08052]
MIRRQFQVISVIINYFVFIFSQVTPLSKKLLRSDIVKMDSA